MMLEPSPINLAEKFDHSHATISGHAEFPKFADVTNFLSQHCEAFDQVKIFPHTETIIFYKNAMNF